MSSTEVWFAIPSANPANCRRTLPVWREMGYKVAVLQNRERAEIPADRVVWSDEYPGWAGSINALCRDVVPASARIVVSGGDDMLPDPHRTAGQIAAEFLEHFAGTPEGTFGVMQPQGDAYDPATVCGSPWLGRAWFTRMYGGAGGLFAGYRHFWADDELYWVARCRGALWCRGDLAQHHQHFLREGAPKPEYWAKNVQGNEAQDTQLFIARAALGFPGHGPAGEGAGSGANGRAGEGTHLGASIREFDAGEFRRNSTRRAEKHWAAHFAHREESPADARMRAALDECAARGEKRIGIFGAGQHTRKLAQSLLSPPVEVVAIIDEDPARQGTRLWNYPVVSVGAARAMRIDALVLSSDSAEERLGERAEAAFAGSGTRIVRLYTGAARAAEVAA